MNLVKIRQMHEHGGDELLSYLDVFRLFYRQNASYQHRHGASREASGSFGATFSDDSGPPDAQVSVFVVFGAPRPFGAIFFLMVFRRFRAWRGTIKGGEQYTDSDS